GPVRVVHRRGGRVVTLRGPVGRTVVVGAVGPTTVVVVVAVGPTAVVVEFRVVTPVSGPLVAAVVLGAAVAHGLAQLLDLAPPPARGAHAGCQRQKTEDQHDQGRGAQEV